MQDARFTNLMDRKRALRLWDEWKNRGDLEKVRAEMRPASAHISPQCTMRFIPKDPLPKSPGVLRDMVLALVTDKDGRLYEPCLPVQAILRLVEAEQTLNNVLEYWETTDGPISEKERMEVVGSLKESLDIVLWYCGKKEEVPSALERQGTAKNILCPQGEVDNVPSIEASEHMAPAQKELVETSAEVKTGRQATRPLELDKEECRDIARLIWKGDPARAIDTVANEIAASDHVVGRPCAWRDGEKSVSTVRKWIKGECPNPRTGRPPKGL